MVRKLVAAVAVAAGFTVMSAGVAGAEQAYVLVRILPNGNEQVLETIPVTEEEQQRGELTEAIRNELLAHGRGNVVNNPAHRYVLYCPTEENVPRTIDDRCWDSLVDL
jgi:hypothetical protein